MRATRLTLVCHASTGATRAARFPADEPLDARGIGDLAGAGRLGSFHAAWTSPALRARQTAEGLGLSAEVDPALRDLDCGRWEGHSLAEIQSAEPDMLAAWLTDSAAAPHGGESIVTLLDRVGGWMRGRGPDGQRIAAVTHAGVIRAAILIALGAPPGAFWRIDVPPLSVVELGGAGGRWNLRSLTPPARKSRPGRKAAPQSSDSGG